MPLSRIGERGFLRALARRHRSVMPPSPRGPGDDAAVAGRRLVTTDALVEGVHFESSEPPFLVGRKALSVNLSDIAAMGGRPTACLLALGASPEVRPAFLESFADGFASVASSRGVEWIGGDTVRSPGPLVLSVTVLGETAGRALTRGGARPGDGLYVSGPLGGSAAGRALLSAGWTMRSPSARLAARWETGRADRVGRRFAALVSPPSPKHRGRGGAPEPVDRETAAVLIARHLDPDARIEEGAFLSGRGLASAAMDLSDGLSTDLARLCEASGAGAAVVAESLPVSRETRRWAARAGVDPLRLALDGGEDYELLFTMPRGLERRLRGWPAGRGTGPFRIGRILPRRKGLLLVDARGRSRGLRPAGYDAFRR